MDALRQHSRAVVLTVAGGGLSDGLRELARFVGTEIEVVDHPFLAVAALTDLERDMRSEGRSALVIAERQIDDLGGLFATIRSRLPRVSIWVFEADLAIEVQRGQVIDPPPPPPPPAPARDPGTRATTAAPVLRIAATDAARAQRVDANAAAEADLREDPQEDPPGPSGNTVTPEELEMLLDLLDRDQPQRRDDGGPR